MPLVFAEAGVEGAGPDSAVAILEDRARVVAGETFARGEGRAAAVHELIQAVFGSDPERAFVIFEQGVDGALGEAVLGTEAFEFAVADSAQAVLSADPDDAV